MKPIPLSLALFLAVAILTTLTTGCTQKKPDMNLEQGRAKTLEERARKMVSESPTEIQKVVLRSNALRLSDPFPRIDKRVTLQTAGAQRLEDIILGLSRELGLNMVYDVRNTRPEDIRDINRQIREINNQFTQKNRGNRPDALVVPPETSIEHRDKDDFEKNQVATSQYTPGNERFSAEDPELFDRVSINFNGNATDLFRKLSDVSGFFFSEKDNIISVRKTETFSMSVPSYPGLLTMIENSVAALGARDVAFDNLSNALSFKADYRGYKRITDYLQKIRDNAALVALHVTILNVKLYDNSNWGIDWNKVSFGRGWDNALEGVTDLARDAAIGAGVLATTGNGGVSLIFDTKDFSLTGFVGFLDEYGKTERGQNAVFECLSGTAGKLENVEQIQYVKNVGAVALSTNSVSTQTTTETDTINVGTLIEVNPFYSNSDKSLTVKLKSEITDLIKFEEFPIPGEYEGTLRLPQTAARKFETTLRLKYNQVAVIGGLITSRDKNETTSVPYVENFITSNKDKEKEQTEMVIVVKPYVTEFVYENALAESTIN